MFKANRKPRLPNPRLYPYWRGLVWKVARVRYLVAVRGEENIPAPGGESRGLEYYPELYHPLLGLEIDSHSFVLAPRHHSLADVVAVGAFKRPFVLVGKPYFAMLPGIKGFFEANGLLAVFRPGVDDKGSKLVVAWRRRVSLTGEEMIARAIRAARLGIPIEIYPEGTREGGGNGRFGAFRIAMEAGVPLIPAGIHYGPRTGWLRRRQVCLVIGRAMDLPDCEYRQLTREQLLSLVAKWDEQTKQLRQQGEFDLR